MLSALTCFWQGVTNSWEHLFVARFVLGLGIGPKSATVPMYAVSRPSTSAILLSSTERRLFFLLFLLSLAGRDGAPGHSRCPGHAVSAFACDDGDFSRAPFLTLFASRTVADGKPGRHSALCWDTSPISCSTTSLFTSTTSPVSTGDLCSAAPVCPPSSSLCRCSLAVSGVSSLPGPRPSSAHCAYSRLSLCPALLSPHLS